MNMECIYLLVVAMCWMSVNADSSEEETVGMYRDGRQYNNMRAAQWTNSISNEYQQVVYYRRQRHCTRIRNVCASNNMIYENYCEFKSARSFEAISRVDCTEGHVRTFYAPETHPEPITSRPQTTAKKIKLKRVQPDGENGSIDNRVNVVPEPIPPTQNTVVMLTTATICDEACPLMYEPVCGTDGIDYPNVCVFEASKCTGNTDDSVTIAYYGACKAATTPPTGNLEGFRYCPEDVCEDEINYVCGTDGVTYDNKCKLLKVACAANNSSLDIDYEGECTPVDLTTASPEPELEPEKTIEPLPTPKKQEMTTEDSCKNPTCKVVWEPVCADDGKTYPSRCVLENINACSNVQLTLLHEGECTKSTTAPAATCTTTCPPLQLEPVCGTDDNSYPSRCILRKYNCDNQAEVEVAYEGECIAVRGDI